VQSVLVSIRQQSCRFSTERARHSGGSANEHINAQIEAARPGANGLLFLPYLLGERSPRCNPNARGALIGLKMEHKRGDIFRGLVEGIAMNLNAILDTLQKDIRIEEMVVIGGLARGSVQRQILADVYEMDVLRLNHLEEATAIGAAVTAGVGGGALEGFEDVRRFVEVGAVSRPIPKNVAVYRKLKPVFDKAHFDLLEVYGQLCALA